MIKYFASFILLLSVCMSAMEITQEKINENKEWIILRHMGPLEKKVERQRRLINWLFLGGCAAGTAAIATKLGYLSDQRIGVRGWSLISGACGLCCIGGISSIGKTQEEIKNLPNIITDDYVRIYLQNQKKQNPKI
ncbi:MAG: hypothetical protein AMXMBFR12_07190 [Candidatus Babeliales bacterium]